MKINVKFYIYGLYLTIGTTFFSISSILGIKYAGKETSNTYLIITFVLAILSLIFSIKNISKTTNIFNFKFTYLPIILSLIYLFEEPSSDFSLRTYLTFLGLVFPAIMIAIDLSINKDLNKLNEVLFANFLILTIAVVTLMPVLISSQVYQLLDFFAGGHYQSFSYSCSFAYLFGLVQINKGLKNKSNIHKILLISSLGLLVLGSFLSGGRGGFNVIVIGTLIFLPRLLRKSKLLIIVSASAFALLFFFSSFNFSVRLFESSTRIFSYIDGNQINMQNTSNRDLFYGKAIDLFYESPIIGNGIFLYANKVGGEFYSHNFFLDILIQGGVLLFILTAIFFYIFFKKIKILFLIDQNYDILLIFIIYSFIQLMFSGTYLNSLEFWFSLSYVFNHNYKMYDSSLTENT